MERIIEFSELKDFMDVPIKNFSSGMFARLGFAVATIYTPDILIVDEYSFRRRLAVSGEVSAEDPRDVGTGNDAFVCVSQYGSGRVSATGRS